MAVVHIAAHPCLGKTSEASSVYFYFGAGINWLNDFKELLNGKLPCSVTLYFRLWFAKPEVKRPNLYIGWGDVPICKKSGKNILCSSNSFCPDINTLCFYVFVFSLFLSMKTKSQADISNKFIFALFSSHFSHFSHFFIFIFFLQ